MEMAGTETPRAAVASNPTRIPIQPISKGIL